MLRAQHPGEESRERLVLSASDAWACLGVWEEVRWDAWMCTAHYV